MWSTGMVDEIKFVSTFLACIHGLELFPSVWPIFWVKYLCGEKEYSGSRLLVCNPSLTCVPNRLCWTTYYWYFFPYVMVFLLCTYIMAKNQAFGDRSLVHGLTECFFKLSVICFYPVCFMIHIAYQRQLHGVVLSNLIWYTFSKA